MKITEVIVRHIGFEKDLITHLREQFVKLRLQLASGKPFTTHRHYTDLSSELSSYSGRDEVILQTVSGAIRQLEQNPDLLLELRRNWFREMKGHQHPGLGRHRNAVKRWERDFANNSGKVIAYEWLLGATKPYSA